MIIKERARKPMARGKPKNPYIAPRGVGEMEGYCVGFAIGDFRVILSKEDWEKTSAQIKQLIDDYGRMPEWTTPPAD